MSIDLWISVLLAIPLAIVANLLTPKIGRWFDSRLETTRHRKLEKTKRSRAAQLKHLTEELDSVRKFHTDRFRLSEHLLHVLLQIAGLGALASVYGGMFSFVGEIGRWDGPLGIVGRTGGQVITLLTSLLIFQLALRAMKLRRRVRDFDKYEAETQRMIDELTEEPIH